MLGSNTLYKEKAIETIRQLYLLEYLNTVGIPFPEIDFLFPDSPHYLSGEYYIKIGDTWQVYFNLGKLPVSYKEFQDEIRVLARHEIEHYLCCPYDVLTHLLMINAIILTYKTNYSHLGLNIGSIASGIANQVADIIVDTKNYRKYPSETLRSEIAWIRKNPLNPSIPNYRHSVLLFLTKEALWGEKLGIDYKDAELKSIVDKLVVIFNENGITNRDLFVLKTIEYANSFFEVYQKDIREKSDADEIMSKPESSSDSIGITSNIPPKSVQGDSQYIFQSPEKIQEALNQLAHETTITQFSDTLSAAGFSHLTKTEKHKIWFNANNQDIIPIIELTQKGSPSSYSFPAAWKVGDQIEDIDLMLSLSISPKIIPGITTKKWIKNAKLSFGVEKEINDLLLVIDTSGSMGHIAEATSNLHQAVLASYGITKYYESMNASIALIGFSDRITAFVDWTRDYELIRNTLLLDCSGGTNFPTQYIQELAGKTSPPIVTAVITDGEVDNEKHTLDFFKQYLSNGNKLYLFLQNSESKVANYKELTNHGAVVAKCLTAEDIRNMVISDIT